MDRNRRDPQTAELEENCLSFERKRNVIMYGALSCIFVLNALFIRVIR